MASVNNDLSNATTGGARKPPGLKTYPDLAWTLQLVFDQKCKWFVLEQPSDLGGC